jgi:hypothetical protein
MVRFADRMVALDLIPPTSRAAMDNPATMALAHKLAIKPPDNLDDFISMSVAAGRR